MSEYIEVTNLLDFRSRYGVHFGVPFVGIVFGYVAVVPLLSPADHPSRRRHPVVGFRVAVFLLTVGAVLVHRPVVILPVRLAFVFQNLSKTFAG